MMRAGLAAAAIAAVWLIAVAPAAAQDPSSPCYELIPARAKIDPPAPMLVDKCSGRTWLLTRGARGVWRWAAIDADGDKPKATDRPPIDKQPGPKDGDGKKCFTFNDRKFCE
jgi:hypothetical protein